MVQTSLELDLATGQMDLCPTECTDWPLKPLLLYIPYETEARYLLDITLKLFRRTNNDEEEQTSCSFCYIHGEKGKRLQTNLWEHHSLFGCKEYNHQCLTNNKRIITVFLIE